MGILRSAPGSRARTSSRVLLALLALLLSVVACTQLAQFVLFTNMAPAAAYDSEAGALVITGLAAAWYATSLRARVPCGALLMGWAAHKVLTLTVDLITGLPRAGLPNHAGVVACAAAGAAILIAIIYMRAFPDPGPRDESDRNTPRIPWSDATPQPLGSTR